MDIEQNSPVEMISPRRLWFGFAIGAVAWLSVGGIYILINWRACMHQEEFGIPNPHPGARILIGVLALVLLTVAIIGGVISYSNWRHLSAQPLLRGEAVERHEFMALLGVVVAVTLGVGILWMAIPPLLLDICWRAR